jgi:hypothetical protein
LNTTNVTCGINFINTFRGFTPLVTGRGIYTGLASCAVTWRGVATDIYNDLFIERMETVYSERTVPWRRKMNSVPSGRYVIAQGAALCC